ncbi:hypothetical protein [Parvularcula sp. IMCC14364]|uniref:hypothetical protein n=1 Tax=Parvularcula sp. IMCC14364 TaxID=3067902 RepID=UPI0027412D54|nr:hypothetical protein [Parvularcula sp. IMCC14364]
MRIIGIGLVALTVLTACGHIARNKDQGPVEPQSNTYFGCNIDELDRKQSYYKKEYNRIWNVMTREFFSERMDVAAGSAARDARSWENLMRQLEYDIDSRYRRVLNSCRSVEDCHQINGFGSGKCTTVSQELTQARRNFDTLEDTLASAATRMDSFRYQLKRPVIPQDTPASSNKSDDDATKKPADNKSGQVNRGKDCSTVGTVFTECK